MSIRTKLILLSVIMGLVFLLIALIAITEMKKAEHLYSLIIKIKQIHITALNMRRSEKDFMLRAIHDENYYHTKESKYFEEFQNSMQNSKQIIDELMTDKMMKQLGLDEGLSKVDINFEEYDLGFRNYIEAISKRGFKSYGLMGNLNNAAQQIEKKISKNENLHITFLTMKNMEKNYLLNKEKKFFKQINRELDRLKRQINLDTRLSVEKKQDLLSEVNYYTEILAEIYSLDKRIGFSEKEGLQKEFRSAIHKIEPSVFHLEKALRRTGEEALFQSHTIVVTIFVILAIILGYYLYYVISSIRKSLSKTSCIIQAVANGDFSQNLQIDNHDEIGSLQKQIAKMINKLRNSAEVARNVSEGNLSILDNTNTSDDNGELDEALRKMVERLKSILSNINELSGSLLSASSQLLTTSQQVAQGAIEQASATEQISTTMEEMTASVNQSLDNAQQTEQISEIAANNMEKGSKRFAETIESIIKISEKILVINEISDKIDMLAINAAVEAARADIHGKGFAVVASEVRKLAENSKRSALEIDDVSKTTINRSQQTLQSLSEISPNVLKTALLVKEIAAANVEQNSGIRQISSAINQLSQVTQENSTTAENLMESANNLEHKILELNRSIDFFKIRN